MDLTDPQILASLLTLTALEIVLGIDNIIFIAIFYWFLLWEAIWSFILGRFSKVNYSTPFHFFY